MATSTAAARPVQRGHHPWNSRMLTRRQRAYRDQRPDVYNGVGPSMCCRDCLVQPSEGILPRSPYRVNSILPCALSSHAARAFLELTEYLGEDAGGGRVLIHHKIRQSDLAAMAGVARENVSRVLSDWKRRDLVTRYHLNDLTTLKRYAVS